MNTKIILFSALICIMANTACAQEGLPVVKLTKGERMWLAAYDDTTKALAWLFINKRNVHTKNQKPLYLVLGASTAAMIGGGLMLERDLNSSPTATYDQANYAGLTLMFVGTAGVLASGTALGISYIALNPYTVKKYDRLLALHKANKPLPEFYVKRMTPYLSRTLTPPIKER
ncbi:MAG: hypothetical protein KF725_10570 [Cyclobacteriaceae bacterium]|nr:hypothetical protein [Cyclobacteriaceae bacterium]UYN86153.1 MAG: hypothetical protein KIT51_14965 [Cyclobacteriaceae bacterium]